MADGLIEVVTGRVRRRGWIVEDKPGIAMDARHGIASPSRARMPPHLVRDCLKDEDAPI